jgi:hypothetical protein
MISPRPPLRVTHKYCKFDSTGFEYYDIQEGVQY